MSEILSNAGAAIMARRPTRERVDIPARRGWSLAFPGILGAGRAVWRMGLAVFLAVHLAGASEARAAAWPVEREWTQEEEAAYAKWFERLASKAWKSANAMLHSREYNSLYDEADKGIFFYADCADLPYVVRAYYAYKRRLPFVANFVSGGRYTKVGNHTSRTIDNLSFQGSAKSFFAALTGVHSGNFRTAPEATDSFTYPIAINRDRLRPGMVFYSPNGHLAMVAEVRPDGAIRLVDGHPDQSVTRITFGPKLEVRSRTYSGGFRGFRTAVVRDGKAQWIEDNSRLPGFSLEQYEFKDYYGTLRERLTRTVVDPLRALENYIREDTYQEVLDRVESVERGWAVGRTRAIPVGSNIYDAVGDWEDYSTPSRDLRLRLSVLHIPEQVQYYMRLLREESDNLETSYQTPEELGRALLDLKDRLFRELSFEYVNSRGAKVRLTLDDLERRLFRLSFDPNHAPELRWGAEGKELETALTSSMRFRAGYEEQQRWRNRLEKKQGRMAPNDSDNPREAPPHNISAMIAAVVEKDTAPALAIAKAEPGVELETELVTLGN